jgi:anti-sigma factor RsiW
MKRFTSDKCPRVETLSLLIDDELPGSARDEIETHAASCRLCGATLRDFRELHQVLARLPATGPDVDIAAMIADRLGPRPHFRTARPRMRWQWQLAPAGLAGAGVLAMGVYLGMLLVGGAGLTAGRPPAVAVFSAVPPGGLCLAPACYAGRR